MRIKYLAFLALFLTMPALAQEVTTTGASSNVVLTGEIVETAGDGFTLSHGNGFTTVTLRSLQNNDRKALEEAGIVKKGSTVTVEGDMTKGDFNKPELRARSLVVVESKPQPDPNKEIEAAKEKIDEEAATTPPAP